MAATVHVRTVQFLDTSTVDDDYGMATTQLRPKKQPELNARSMSDSGDGTEVWFKDNRLGHRQQAAYLLRLERLRQELHDTEQGRLRDSLDRLLCLRPPSKAADALASAPTSASALADRRAPWLARSPEEHALLQSARDGARNVRTRRERTSEPPAPTVKRLLAASDARRAKKASAGPPSPHDAAEANAAGSGKEIALPVSTRSHRPLAFLLDEPAANAAQGVYIRASPPCAPTIPTLNRTPAKISTATSDGGERTDRAYGRCARTAPAGGGSSGQRKAKLVKRGSLARAVTAIKEAGGGERSQRDPSSLIVPGRRVLATPAAVAYNYSTSSTPREDDGYDDVMPIELVAAGEAGLRVVMPDPGARTISRSTDVKCESAAQRHDRDDLAQRARSVAFVENPT